MSENNATRPAGLSQQEADRLKKQWGGNNIRFKQRTFLKVLSGIVSEPMFILLVIATSVYFITGEHEEGLMTAAAIVIVTAVSIYQDVRSSHALEALKAYTQEKITVIRDGVERLILTEDLVPGDIIVLVEGNLVPADAKLLDQHDFTVNESVITGESLPVEKNAAEGSNLLYQGTTVNSGNCRAIVTETGNRTQLGKLGKTAGTLSAPKTLLQKQVGRYVKQLAIFGLSAFVLIWIINYSRSGDVLQSLLFGLVLAMAAIPEEIPVAFSTFIALGAYQLSKMGIITRNPQVIENLGTVNVICLDKTGTITENRMTVKDVFVFENGKLTPAQDGESLRHVLRYATLASEQAPFDAMEKAIIEAYRLTGTGERRQAMIREYPLEGKPPMMTHVYGSENGAIVAGKGAVERILKVCGTKAPALAEIQAVVQAEASKGYRVIGVARASWGSGPWPASQDEFSWEFAGLVCLYDPPRKNVPEVISRFYQAGVAVKLITGDFLETAVNISGQAGIKSGNEWLTGDQVMSMTDAQLAAAAERVSIFARMFPEAKQRVVKTLQANGHIVAMIGDGVNDVPALKMSDIGIAMGKKGTEMAREASDLVITDDKLEKIAEAVRQGRKIFLNLKKSIRYIITIHIPIILTATLPLLFNWPVLNIFTPIHIIFLELIMGPTCSLFFEREPVEADIMQKPPRNRKEGILNRHEMGIGVVQGLVVTVAVLGLYFFRMRQDAPVELIRTEVLTTLLFANIFLTLADRSFSAHFFQTVHYHNKLAPWVLITSVMFIVVILLVPAARETFGLVEPGMPGVLTCLALAFGSVAWYELYKYFRQRQHHGPSPLIVRYQG